MGERERDAGRKKVQPEVPGTVVVPVSPAAPERPADVQGNQEPLPAQSETPTEAQSGIIRQVHELNVRTSELLDYLMSSGVPDSVRHHVISELELLRTSWRQLALESAAIPYEWYRKHADEKDGTVLGPYQQP